MPSAKSVDKFLLSQSSRKSTGSFSRPQTGTSRSAHLTVQPRTKNSLLFDPFALFDLSCHWSFIRIWTFIISSPDSPDSTSPLTTDNSSTSLLPLISSICLESTLDFLPSTLSPTGAPSAPPNWARSSSPPPPGSANLKTGVAALARVRDSPSSEVFDQYKLDAPASAFRRQQAEECIRGNTDLHSSSLIQARKQRGASRSFVLMSVDERRSVFPHPSIIQRGVNLTKTARPCAKQSQTGQASRVASAPGFCFVVG